MVSIADYGTSKYIMSTRTVVQVQVHANIKMICLPSLEMPTSLPAPRLPSGHGTKRRRHLAKVSGVQVCRCAGVQVCRCAGVLGVPVQFSRWMMRDALALFWKRRYWYWHCACRYCRDLLVLNTVRCKHWRRCRCCRCCKML
jgi:hypothetical protein